jgi:hypothetical protein
VVAGCGPDKDKDEDQNPDGFGLDEPRDEFGLTAEGKRWWIDKASRTLRLGTSATDAEVAEWMPLTYDAIADRLIADPRFADTLIDFNYYYFGFKSDKRSWPSADDPASQFINYFDIPQAVDGAKQVMAGGDVLAMLDDQRIYAQPFGAVFDYEKGTYVAEGATERRKELYKNRLAAVDATIAYLKGPGDKWVDEYCIHATAITSGSEMFDPQFPPGFREGLFAGEDIQRLTENCYDLPYPGDGGEVPADDADDSDDDSDDADDADGDDADDGDDDTTDPVPNPNPDYPTPPRRTVPEGTLERVERVKARLTKLVDYFLQFEPDRYVVRTAADVRLLDLKLLGIEDQRDRMTMSWFFSRMPNSSTNYNRKRANYALKRFFCDDLTPVNVVLPDDHAGGRHGTDPGCQSCHYKLDPMAGFFRYQGGYGGDVKGSEEIFFSDGATKPLKEYLKEWRSGDAARPWNVGYVRSTTDASLNDYSDNPKDPDLKEFFSLLKRAPEVKQCLVKRVSEYVIGEGQAMDPGYLAEVTNRYTDVRETNASAAFKDTFKTLALSKTFRTRDPVSEECYDQPANAAEGTRPPCKVAFILERHCAQCHRGASAAGGLDLTKWTNLDGGYGFPDSDGAPRMTSLQAVYDRLATADPALKMPLGKHMDVADRDALFLWITKQLEGGQP